MIGMSEQMQMECINEPPIFGKSDEDQNALADGFLDVRPLALVVAHPDDEVIGAGAQFATWRDIQFVHVTDGAPRNLSDAKANGFADCEAYARARELELKTALNLAGLE